jgi:hypothetical protein
MRRPFILILFLVFGTLTTEHAFAQCASKVEANAKIVGSDLGEIKVDISSSERFICKLNSISGRGSELVQSQNGSGNSTITFSDLDITKIYQVEVEFITEEKELCRRLQQNDLVFESK